MNELRRTNIYYPYDSHAQYCLAKSLSTPRLPSATVINAVAVEGADTFIREGVSFSSVKQFYNRLDSLMLCQSRWESTSIVDTANPSNPEIQYWSRDSLAVLQEILENRELADKCVWAPVKQYNSEGERVYTDMHTADWWWDLQVGQLLVSMLISAQDFGP
jgi:hypothetical protein